MRAFDAYKILDEQEAGSLIDLIAPCMDDYLYIIDLKNDTLRICLLYTSPSPRD